VSGGTIFWTAFGTTRVKNGIYPVITGRPVRRGTVQSQADGTNMDETKVTLPRYVFRRANGSFRYKRNVPKRLRNYFKKATLYRQLGNTYREAMDRLPKVHQEIEDLFAFEKMLSPEERARALAVANFGESTVRASELSGMYNEDGDPVFQEFGDLVYDLEGLVPHDVLVRLSEGKFKSNTMTLERAFLQYRKFKEESDPDPQRTRDLNVRLDRLRKDITAALGDAFYKEIDLAAIRRKDANALRDHMLGKMSANSVVRYLNILKAAVNYVIREEDIEAKNPFAQLKVAGSGASKQDRLPLSQNDFEAAIPHFQDKPEVALLFWLLADSGARLGEIVGLEVQDIDLSAETIHLRPNEIRRLKTTSSERILPLSKRAVRLLRPHIAGKAPQDAIFPRYETNRGADRASAMMMKRLRKSISDPKKSMHSLRHRMKDELRNTGCPEDLSRVILGHATNSIAANYGSGYAISRMREAMEKVWET
jgi:integrase